MSIALTQAVEDLKKQVQALVNRVDDLEKQRIYDLTHNTRETLKLKRG